MKAATNAYAMLRCGMATKRSNPRKDFTQTALDVVRQATGETATPAPGTKPDGGRKTSAAKKAPTPRKPD